MKTSKTFTATRTYQPRARPEMLGLTEVEALRARRVVAGENGDDRLLRFLREGAGAEAP